jgi:hypothetical protein
MDAASEASEFPIVETSCPVHKKEKSRFRKTEKVDVVLGSVDTVIVHAFHNRVWLDARKTKGLSGKKTSLMTVEESQY